MEKYSMYEKHVSIIISLLLVTSFLSISLITIPLVSAAETTIQPSSADSYMNEGAKDTNYGGQTYIEVSSKPSAWGNARGILKFDLSSIPSGSTITSATLSLYLYSTRGYDRTYCLHKVTKNWIESGVTWNKYDGTNNWTTSGGDYATTASATVTAGAVYNTWINWSSSTLASDVQGFVNNPSTNFGWIIKDQTEGSSNQDWVRFYSKEYTGTTLRPKLAVTYTTGGDTTPPAAPTGLTATAVSSSQIDLDWNNNTEGDLSHYHVYRSTTSGFTPGPGNFVADTTVSNYSDMGLSASTTYYYKVTAVDTSNNESSPSAQASATTQPSEDTTPPAAPTGLTATAVSSSQINLDWANNTEGDLDHYNVYRSTTSGFTPGPGNFVASTTVSNYSDTGLSASTTYYYKVTAVDTSNNESSPSAQASATTQTPPPTGAWDFECHSYTHPDAITAAELQQVNNAFAAHGLPEPLHHAYPYGNVNQSVCSQYRLSGRTVGGIMETQYPVPNWYQLKATEIQNTTAWSTIKGWVDQCISQVGLLHIFSHRVMDPAPQYGMTPTMLHQLLDYLVDRQNAGQLTVRTMRDAYNAWNGTAPIVVISFDDGWLSDYENVWPLFKEHSLVGTSYIYPQPMDESWSEFMGWAMIEEMAGLRPPRPAPGPSITHAGCRSSSYGISPFPSAEEWETDMKAMASYWPGSQPTGIWIVGTLQAGGTDCYLEFPSDGGNYDYIVFDTVDRHESYLDYFDTHGIKVWLQVEPGFADMNTLIDLVLNRYGNHSCVAGFGVDVEWYRYTAQDNLGVPVTDANAQAWESRVKSHNANYTLFLKHFDWNWMPWNYRGDIVFVDDSQGFTETDYYGLPAMVSEFTVHWAPWFYPNPVWFQIGYPADQVWWDDLANPPKNIGDAIDAETTQATGILWVDFTLRDVFPPGADTTPPAAPTGLTATAVSSSQINLDWANNTEGDLDHYNVYRSTTSGFTPGPGNFVASTTVSNYSNTGLSASTTYYYKVTAVDTSGNESSPSAQASATTQAAPTMKAYYCDVDAMSSALPMTVGGNLNSKTEATSAQYTAIGSSDDSRWMTSDPGDGDEVFLWLEMNVSESVPTITSIELHFEGYLRNSAATFSIWARDVVNSIWVQIGTTQSIATGADGTITRTITSNIGNYIDASGKLIWGVYESTSSQSLYIDYVRMVVGTAADTTPPVAPTGLTATAVSSSQINLDWANNTEGDLDHYNVYRSTTSGFTPGPGNFVASTTVSNYSNTGLSASTTYYYKVTAVDTSNNESNPSAQASATTQAAPPPVTHAGVRASSYGISPFPSAEEWETDMKAMASYWPGSQPTGIWLVGLMEPPDVLGSTCHLEFPEPAGGPYQNITFESTDLHESYLDYFDTHGINVWLQVEPGDANMSTLIDLVLNQYGHHSCVKGFGLDVEWYTTTGASVTDSNAQSWESRVKSHNSNYTLFIKYWNIDRTPPTYRGDIIFVDDSQQFSSLAEMVSEFANYWAPEFYPNPVWFQYGYEADRVWWQNLTNPPKDIGDAIDAAVPQDCGFFWVDFTLRDVFPPGGDTTPPAAPTGLTATAVSSSQINLDWANNTEGDLSHYHVYRSTTSGFTPGAGNFVADTTVSNYSDTGLSASTTYYYKVTAVDTNNNESSPSAQASATTQEGPPPPPPGGWDFQCHSYTHPYLTQLTVAQIQSEMQQVNNAFAAHGLPAPQHHAYPYGEFNSTVKSVIAQYRLSGRAAWAYTGSINTYPMADWYQMNAVEIQASTAVSTITGYIDYAISNNALLNIFTHRVMDPAPQYGCTPTTLRAVCSYLLNKQNAGQLQVLPMRDAYTSWNGTKAVVVLSFDDGWKTDYTTTWGIVTGEYGFVGTSYIYPAAMDGQWTDFLSWAQVQEMAGV